MAAVNKTKLSSGDMKLLDVYANETLTDYCAGCSHICEASVSEDVPICDIMRFLMYQKNYENPQMAVELFNEIPLRIRNVLIDIDYRDAEKKCPRNLAIGKLMKEAYTSFA
jgi:hypothetical protein